MIIEPSLHNILQVVDCLKDDQLIGLPTETVYGLAANALSDQAVAKIFDLKKRPTFNPLIVHGASKELFLKHVHWNEWAQTLAGKFWPGPLTFILPRHKDSTLSLLVSAGMNTVAVRIPAHPIALKLLEKFGSLLAAPSANLSGRISPTSAKDVEIDFPQLLILDGGASPIGVESTVIDLTGKKPVLLRPGGVCIEDIEACIGRLDTNEDKTIKSPGMLLSHYAPLLPVRLNVDVPLPGEAYLAFGPGEIYPHMFNLSSKADLREAAANLFKMLRQLDTLKCHTIAVAPIPTVGLGVAINDRLQRAAAPRD